ncbi:MAG: hypothetical protein V3T41_08475 [bacterium]
MAHRGALAVRRDYGDLPYSVERRRQRGEPRRVRAVVVGYQDEGLLTNKRIL